MQSKIGLLLPLRCLLFIFSGLALFFITNQSFEDLSKWWSVICSICNIITLVILLAVCRKKGVSYGKFIGFEKKKTKLKSIFLWAFGILVVGMGGMYLAGVICYGKFPYMAAMMIQPIPLWLALINILILPITTTLAEDGVYLGVINQNDSKPVVIMSAVFYALQHSFIPLMPDGRFIIYRFLSFLPLTAIMCIWYCKSKNPLPLMVGHFIINLATVAQIVMTSASPAIFEQMSAM